jgi:hypothetical protein
MIYFIGWLFLTIIYALALFLERKIHEEKLQYCKRSAYLQGRIDTLKEYCEKMELIDRIYNQVKTDNNIIDIEVE